MYLPTKMYNKVKIHRNILATLKYCLLFTSRTAGPNRHIHYQAKKCHASDSPTREVNE